MWKFSLIIHGKISFTPWVKVFCVRVITAFHAVKIEIHAPWPWKNFTVFSEIHKSPFRVNGHNWYMKCFIYWTAGLKSTELWSSQLWTQFKHCVQKPEKVRTLTGFQPVTSQSRCDTLTNWAMKPLTLGAGHLWVLSNAWRMDVKWYMKCFICWTVHLKSGELWSLQLWMQFKQLSIEAWKSQDFNGVWTHDLAIPVWRSNQLSYKGTVTGSWSFVTSDEPVKNGCELIYEMFHLLNCGFKINWAMIITVMNAIKQLRIEGWKSQDFNWVWTRNWVWPVRCLTNWAMKPLTFGAHHLWVLMSP